MELQWKRKETRTHLREIHKGGVVYLQFPSLEQTGIVRHGFSTRIGGVSEGIFSTMNLSFSRGDDERAVRENYKRMAHALGTEPGRMVCSVQTHTTNIRMVTAEDKGKGVCRPLDYTDTDGLITNEPGIMLVTFYADCVPIYIVDTHHHAIGLCHSGWRGTAGRISRNMLRRMAEEYHTQPGQVLAAIGPSICRECYEVSNDVAEVFRNEFGVKAAEQFADAKEDGKYQLDLWEANRMILEEAGVPAENIEITDLCTCCNPDYLFSHRASDGKRGNLAAFLELTPV